MRKTHHDLLSLGEVVGRVAIQRHFAQWRDGNEFLRDDLSRVQEIESVSEFITFIHDLDTELSWHELRGPFNNAGRRRATYLPFGESSCLNIVKQILAMEIRILSRCNLSLFPHQTRLARQRLEMEFDKPGSLMCDHAECMNTEPVHMSE
jgi:hypothetical protein